LARLLADTELWRAFVGDPDRVANQLPIRDADRDAFLSLNVEELERQAKTLVDKRLHEVGRIIPRSMQRLGCRASSEFYRYANQNWPTGHKRQFDDALAFSDFLITSGNRHNVCHSERNWLRFGISQRRFALHLVSDLLVGKKQRRAIQFLYRHNDGTPRQFAIYLSL
jgi:hypothetical protein